MCIPQSNLQGLDPTYIEKKKEPHVQKEEKKNIQKAPNSKR